MLFIGEAPGESEDATGIPFKGRAGQLLRLLLSQLRTDLGRRLPSWGIINVVCCRPQDENFNNRPPTPAEAEACRPHILEYLELASPQLVVLLGNSAKDAWKPIAKVLDVDYKTFSMKHPAAFLRSGLSGDRSFKDNCRRSLEFKRSYYSLRDEFKLLM